MSDTIPKSSTAPLPSGRFLLRIDPELHAYLRESADAAGISLNEFCSRSLTLPPSDLPEAILDAVGRAVLLLKSSLLGVVAFGSWARNQMVEGSDVDLLMVVGSEVPIRRSLYRTWDRTPSEWDGHRIEPHFVHLPVVGARVSGLWAEVVVDGVVLFDRELTVSRRLAGFRRRLASGEFIRRWSSGHPYWVEGS